MSQLVIKTFRLVVVAGLTFGYLGLHCKAAGAITGTVVDETSAPLQFVEVQMRGFEEFENGQWVRRIRSGGMPVVKTDKHGRFTLETTATRRYDLGFDRYGLGPKFLWGVADETSILVVMAPGVVIRGAVTRRGDDGSTTAIPYPPVLLRLPGPDFWYEQRAVTDKDGMYELRASQLSEGGQGGRKWLVTFLDEVIPITVDVRRGEIKGPTFEVEIDVR